MTREEELLSKTLSYLFEVINDSEEYFKVLEHIGFNEEEIKKEREMCGCEL